MWNVRCEIRDVSTMFSLLLSHIAYLTSQININSVECARWRSLQVGRIPTRRHGVQH